MRIVHVVTLMDDSNSYGGPVTVALNHCRELQSRGHEASIVGGWAGYGAPPLKVEDVPLRLFKVRRVIPGARFAGLYSRGLVAWIKRHAMNVDVAHIHLSRDLIPLLAARIFVRHQVPYVAQTHGMVIPDKRIRARAIDRLLTVPLLRRAGARLVLTGAEATALNALCPAPLELTHTPNGIPVPEIYSTASIEDEVLDVLFMARLHSRKRVLAFAEAAKLVCRATEGVQFSIVGPDDGDLPRLRRFLAMNPAIQTRLRYEGPLPHDAAMDRLSKAHVYVLPSVDEPFPMSLLEAAGRGVPSICTTSCAAGRDLAAKGAVNLAEPDPDAIAEAVVRIIGDPAQFEALRTTGTKVVNQEYSVASVVDQLEEIYTRVATTRETVHTRGQT